MSTSIQLELMLFAFPARTVQNENVSEHDKRLKFVTGFSGTNGEACITAKSAAFWTDSRYHIQAEEQLDSEVWTLMKEGERDVDGIDEWLCKVLPPNSRVGIDPMLILASRFAALNERLLLCGHELVAVNSNLVHLVWNATRPKPTHNDLRPVDMHYSGGSLYIPCNCSHCKVIAFICVDFSTKFGRKKGIAKTSRTTRGA